MPAIETTITVKTEHKLTLGDKAHITTSITRVNDQPRVFFHAERSLGHLYGSAAFDLTPAEARAVAGLLFALADDAEGK